MVSFTNWLTLRMPVSLEQCNIFVVSHVVKKESINFPKTVFVFHYICAQCTLNFSFLHALKLVGNCWLGFPLYNDYSCGISFIAFLIGAPESANRGWLGKERGRPWRKRPPILLVNRLKCGHFNSEKKLGLYMLVFSISSLFVDVSLRNSYICCL